MNRGQIPEPKIAEKLHNIYLAGEPNLPIRKIGYTTNLELRIKQIKDEAGLPLFEMMDSFAVTGKEARNIEDIIKMIAPRTPYTYECNQSPRRKFTEYFRPGIENLFKFVKSMYMSSGYESLLKRSIELNKELETAHSDFVKECGHDQVRLDGIKGQVYLGSRFLLAKNDLSVSEELESRMARLVGYRVRKSKE